MEVGPYFLKDKDGSAIYRFTRYAAVSDAAQNNGDGFTQSIGTTKSTQR